MVFCINHERLWHSKCIGGGESEVGIGRLIAYNSPPMSTAA